MSRADIILKLKVGKDKRTVAPVETGGHISYFFRTFSGKIKEVLKFNLLYTAIFALPLLFSAFGLPMILSRLVFTGKSYVSNFGIGFPGVADDVNASLAELFYDYRTILFPCLIGSILIAVFGFSGLFHVARGFMWGEKVKTKSFFRGIRALWKPFLLVAFAVAAISAGIMYSVGWHMELLLTTGANAGSWILFILAILAGLFTVAILIVLLPTFACYDFKFTDALGNAFKFFALMVIPNLFIAVICSGLLMLSAIGEFMGLVIGGLLLLMGFMFFAMMWTTYAQYLFDAFIVPQVDSEGNRKEVSVKKYENKRAKAKQNLPAEKKDRSATKKPASQNRYNSSYKRKADASNKGGKGQNKGK